MGFRSTVLGGERFGLQSARRMKMRRGYAGGSFLKKVPQKIPLQKPLKQENKGIFPCPTKGNFVLIERETVSFFHAPKILRGSKGNF